MMNRADKFMNAQQVLDFWFAIEHQSLWFEKSDQFDQEINKQFAALHQAAKMGELWTWREDAEGRLAEIIILDQFSRNLYRDQPEAFAQDNMAVVLAQEAISLQQDKLLKPLHRKFIYMPFMHSESKIIHEYALKLFQQLGDELTLDFEQRHKNIIDRFARYPHRNQILGRASTQEELLFLTQPDSHF